MAKGAGEIADTVARRAVRIRYSREHQSAEAFDAKGQPFVATTLFWFAWAAFHPETELYRAPRAKSGK